MNKKRPTTKKPSDARRPFNVLLALSRYDYRTHRGVAQFAVNHGWHLNCEMAITGKPPQNWHGDGILALFTNDQDTVDFVVDSGAPFVDIAIMREDIPAPRVSADHKAIGLTAANYYLAKGFRYFAFFSTTDDKAANLRRDAFFEATTVRSLSTRDWTQQNERDTNENLSEQLRLEINKGYFPLAVFCTRDSDASIALNICIQENISVPNQVAILGVDNNELINCALRVPLSSVNHNVEALGFAGAELLHEVMCKPSEYINLLGEPRLITPTGITSRLSTDCFAVSNNTVRNSLIHINKHSTNRHYSVNQAADFCKLSRRHLDNLFIQELGHSMHTELTKIRLRAAQNALMTTMDSVETISHYCGFSRVQYFNNCFKKYTGVTPLKYRNTGRQGAFGKLK